MVGRISESQVARTAISKLADKRAELSKYGEEISTGLKVINPGDSKIAATITQYQDSLTKIEGYEGRVSSVLSGLTFQDNVMEQVGELMIKAKELAVQGSNENARHRGAEPGCHGRFSRFVTTSSALRTRAIRIGMCSQEPQMIHLRTTR